MRLPFYISSRFIKTKKRSFSKTIIRLAIFSTALSVALMILSIAVVLGFKETIKDKMFVFWGNIEVAPFNPNPSAVISPHPFSVDTNLMGQMAAMAGVERVDPYLLKPAILQSDHLMEGLKIKGVRSGYPLQSQASIRFEGKPLMLDSSGYANQILVSGSTLKRMDKQIGDSIFAYFLNPDQEYPRVRKLEVCGTFHTGVEEIDQNFALADMRLLQRVSNWQEDQINGYQVVLADYTHSAGIARKIYEELLEPPMSATTMEDIYPNIFSWLELMNRNAYIILIIMAVVAVINLSTAILIFILERTNMVGILKTLGMPMRQIKQIFLYHAGMIAFKGILWGILVGVGISYAQDQWHFIRLDEAAYYMEYMPIYLKFSHVLLIGVATLVFSLLVFWIPLMIVRRIPIIKAIRLK